MKKALIIILPLLPLLMSAQTYFIRTIAVGTSVNDTLYVKINTAGVNTDSLYRLISGSYVFAYASKVKNYIPFPQLSQKPTSLAGYGIIDGVPFQTLNDTSAAIRQTIEGISVGAATWGTILGTLSNQIDLQNAFNAKLSSNGNGSALTGLTKSQVGLALVDNTTDANKPVSTATQTALNAKQNTITVLPFANGGISPSTPAPATTGTMTINMTSSIITITPTGACTFNGSGGVAGQLVTFSITTSGTSSFVLTWGTNFRKVGTLATGTVSARFFTVTFRCLADNGIWTEVGRTAAQT